MNLQQRRKNLCRAIELAYASLCSHFTGTFETPRKRSHIPLVGDKLFNASTIREYAEIIFACASELEYIAKEEKRKRKPRKETT